MKIAFDLIDFQGFFKTIKYFDENLKKIFGGNEISIYICTR
jgi:hypothetical protein